MIDYKEKYLKYKNKYINLKQYGGNQLIKELQQIRKFQILDINDNNYLCTKKRNIEVDGYKNLKFIYCRKKNNEKVFNNEIKCYLLLNLEDDYKEKIKIIRNKILNQEISENKIEQNEFNKNPHITIMEFIINQDNIKLNNNLSELKKIIKKALIEFKKEKNKFELEPDNEFSILSKFLVLKYKLTDIIKKKITKLRTDIYNGIQNEILKTTKLINKFNKNNKYINYYDPKNKNIPLFAVPYYMSGYGQWTPHLSILHFDLDEKYEKYYKYIDKLKFIFNQNFNSIVKSKLINDLYKLNEINIKNNFNNISSNIGYKNLELSPPNQELIKQKLHFTI